MFKFYRVIAIMFVVLIASPSFAQEYSCEDTRGDIEGEKFKLWLAVNEYVLTITFINKENEVVMVTQSQIVHQTQESPDISVIAINTAGEGGIDSFSMHRSLIGTYNAVRTHVHRNGSFTQHSECYLQ